MRGQGFVDRVLQDERLTCGLGDAEARMLVEWLVERVERWENRVIEPGLLASGIARLCRRGRAISHFVRLWCTERQRGAAIQLAASEHCDWPLPVERDADPCEVMGAILAWEEQAQAAAHAA